MITVRQNFRKCYLKLTDKALYMYNHEFRYEQVCTIRKADIADTLSNDHSFRSVGQPI